MLDGKYKLSDYWKIQVMECMIDKYKHKYIA